jgi:ribosomal protein S18 acetylase RimI-like enzyme
MSMQVTEMPSVRTAGPADEEAVISVITLAFSCDPMVRWGYCDPQQYLREMPHLVRAFAGKAFACGGAYCLDGYTGAALWLRPGVEPDEEPMVALLERTLPPEKLPDVFSVLEQMNGHHPPEPHWYLPMIGVDPACHGRGYGSLLLRQVLDECDREKVPAYLESAEHGALRAARLRPDRHDPVRYDSADRSHGAQAAVTTAIILLSANPPSSPPAAVCRWGCRCP